MFRKGLNQLLRFKSGFSCKGLFVAFFLLLSACGDSCYDDQNISDSGRSYYKKNYSHQVMASEEDWVDTGINLESGDTFTFVNIQGQISGCNSPNSVGSCAISYATMCQNNQKYLCTDSTCNSTTLLNDCSGISNCTQSDRCTGISGKNKCVSGVLYNYDDSSSTWVQQDGGCIETVFCNSSSNKILRTTYQTGSGSSASYSNVDRTIGTCSVNEKQCANGHPYSIGSQGSQWVQIDNGILPGDDIHLSILPPRTGAATMSSSASPNNDATLNAWASRYTPRGSNSSCPSTYTLETSQSSYTGCQYLNNGYYTCPFCESQSSHRPTDANVLKACSGNGGELQCWYVGGAGLLLKLINTTEDCNDSQTCSDGDSNCIWFDQYTGSDTTNKFGVITYEPINSDGNGCSSDLTKCNNRTTKRHMTGPSGQTSRMCVKIADPGPFNDNMGGYTVNVVRANCVATDGRPSPVADYWGKPGWYGLEYIISSDTPSTSQRGSTLSEQVQYPYTVNIPNSGKLYMRVRDDTYSDNTGFYDVFIQYHDYFSGGTISGVIESVKDLLRSMTFNSATQYFHNITCVGDACNCQQGVDCRSQYLDYIQALLTLYIAGYGLSFMIGFVEITQFDLFMRIIKVGLVIAIISPGSFDFFYNDFFNLFFDGMDDLIRKTQSGFASGTSTQGPVFSFADSMISLTLLSKTTWLKLLGLMFTTVYGLILSVMLIVAVLIFLLGIFKAVVVYLLATLVLGILMLLAPIFIPFVLFDTTRHLFENWVRMFAQYTLEPIILLIGLSFMTQLLYQLFTEIIDFHVCWKCMWPINMPFVPNSIIKGLGLSETIFCLQFFGPFGVLPSGGAALITALGLEMVDIVIVIILCHLILSYDVLVQQMVLRVTGGQAAQFMVSGKLGDFSSAGSAATHILSRAEVRGASIAALGAGAAGAVKNRARRAAMRLAGGKPEEESLLNQAKGVDKQHRLEIAQRSAAFSQGFNNVLSGDASAEKEVLKNANASKEDQAIAAESIGRKAYSAMGDKEEFKGLVDNFSLLSSVEEGSKAHAALSGNAKKLHSVLQTENAKESLKTLSNSGSSEAEKIDASGRLFQTIHQENPELHSALHGDDPKAMQDLAHEVNNLERTPRDALKMKPSKEGGVDE